MPAGLLVTEPDPVPDRDTVKLNDFSVKSAVTLWAACMVTSQEPLPLQAPDQPVKVELDRGRGSIEGDHGSRGIGGRTGRSAAYPGRSAGDGSASGSGFGDGQRIGGGDHVGGRDLFDGFHLEGERGRGSRRVAVLLPAGKGQGPGIDRRFGERQLGPDGDLVGAGGLRARLVDGADFDLPGPNRPW